MPERPWWLPLVTLAPGVGFLLLLGLFAVCGKTLDRLHEWWLYRRYSR